MNIDEKENNICWVEKTLKIIGQKWTILILHHLQDGPMRFGQLQRALSGISPRTLALRLDQLEDQNFITKKIFPVVPLHVEYTLTKKGTSLGEVIKKMGEWGEKENAQELSGTQATI